MKVMHVIVGLDRGGAEGALSRLVLHDQRNQHTVVSLQDRGVHGDVLERGGIPLYTLGMRRGRIRWSNFRDLLKIVRRERPDVIQTWMYHSDLLGGLAGRLAGVDTIVWGIRHSTLDPDDVPLATRVLARVCAAVSRIVPAAVVSCSQEGLRLHQSMGYPAEKMAVIPNGYDCRRLQADENARRRIRAETGTSDTGLVVLGTVARWSAQKDHATLFAAVAQTSLRDLDRLRCFLVGPGMTSSNLELIGLLERFNLREKVILFGDRADASVLMNAFDLHVLSSSWGEGFPNVVAESMACGVPSIVTDIGDSSLVVGDTGWVVKPKAPELLASAIHDALEAMGDSARWVERKSACRDRITGMFSLEQMVESYREVWQTAASGAFGEGVGFA